MILWLLTLCLLILLISQACLEIKITGSGSKEKYSSDHRVEVPCWMLTSRVHSTSPGAHFDLTSPKG